MRLFEKIFCSGMKLLSFILLLVATTKSVIADPTGSIIFAPPEGEFHFQFGTFLVEKPGARVPIPAADRERLAEGMKLARLVLLAVKDDLTSSTLLAGFDATAAVLARTATLRTIYVERVPDQPPTQSFYHFMTDLDTGVTINLNSDSTTSLMQFVFISLTPQTSRNQQLLVDKQLKEFKTVRVQLSSSPRINIIDEQAPQNALLVTKIQSVTPLIFSLCRYALRKIDEGGFRQKQAEEIQSIISAFGNLRALKVRGGSRKQTSYFRFRLAAQTSGGVEVTFDDNFSDMTAPRIFLILCRLFGVSQSNLRSLRYIVEAFQQEPDYAAFRSPDINQGVTAMDGDDEDAASALINLAKGPYRS